MWEDKTRWTGIGRSNTEWEGQDGQGRDRLGEDHVIEPDVIFSTGLVGYLSGYDTSSCNMESVVS